MKLSASDRVRYARHLLLPQLGESGQERLLSARVRLSLDADPGALAIAQQYLSRAGVRTTPDGDRDAGLPSLEQVDAVAGDPCLREAARALLGALTAVDVVLTEAAITARPLSSIPVLSSEEA